MGVQLHVVPIGMSTNSLLKKNKATIYNKHVVDQKVQHFEKVRFRVLCVRIRGAFYKIK
jgi:hypothetical protein